MYIEPKRVIDDVEDYIGEVDDDFVDNYETIAKDDLSRPLTADEVKESLASLCELSLSIWRSRNGERNIRLLDCGAGYGFILKSLPADEKIALDISLRNLKAISFECRKLRANAEDIPLPDAWCDAVVCTDVIEHVQNADKCAAELQRVIRPGGLLMLAAPWEQDLSVYETEEYITKYKKYKYVHLRSINNALIGQLFPSFRVQGESMVVTGMKHMTIKPYPIKFFQMMRI